MDDRRRRRVERLTAAYLSRLQADRRVVRRRREDATRTTDPALGRSAMQDLDRLRADLEAAAPEDRARRIEEEIAVARAAIAAGAADPAAIAGLEEITGASIAAPRPADAGVLRDRMLSMIDTLNTQPAETVSLPRAQVIAQLAAAADSLDRILCREPSPETAATINVDKLAGDVWHAAQEGNRLRLLQEAVPQARSIPATAFGDVAAAAVREVLS